MATKVHKAIRETEEREAMEKFQRDVIDLILELSTKVSSLEAAILERQPKRGRDAGTS